MAIAVVCLVPMTASALVPPEQSTRAWFLFDVVVTTQEESVGVVMKSDGVGRGWIFAWEADGWPFNPITTSPMEFGTRSSVSSDDAQIVVGTPPAYPSSGGVGIHRGFSVPGTYTAVVLVGGDFEAYTVTTPGVTLRAQGPAHVYESGDLAEGLEVGVNAAEVVAHAAIGGRLAFDVEHTLFGVFNYDQLYGIADLHATAFGTSTLTGPDGVRACPCILDQVIAGPRHAGPGAYEFALDGGMVGAFEGPVAMFADIPV